MTLPFCWFSDDGTKMIDYDNNNDLLSLCYMPNNTYCVLCYISTTHNSGEKANYSIFVEENSEV